MGAKRFKSNKDSVNKTKGQNEINDNDNDNVNNTEEQNKINNKNELKEEKKKFNINYFFIFVFLCVFVFSIYQIAIWYIDIKNAENTHKDLLEQVVITNVMNTVENPTVEEGTRIDFEKLLGINKDVKGWIIIDGTNINYPILQSYDNNYYLKRDINKNISKSGSIYLDYRNNNFEDTNTILYGHNMKNGTMFAELEKIYNNELGSDVKIKIFTQTEERIYKVFSTYVVKPENFDMNTNIDEMQKKSKIDFNILATKYNKVLTLFTCTDSMSGRIIVHAVLEE